MGPEQDGVYSIGAVAKMLAVPAQTLRSWEERYQQVVPQRSAGGQRLYSRDQVDQLRFVLEEMSRGMQPADAHRLLRGRDRSSAEPGAGDGDDGAVTLLLAERDPFAAELSDYFLRTEGYSVRVALNVRDARAILAGEPIALLIVDALIAGGAGLELCELAHQSGTTGVLMVSTLATRDQALQAGADAFLQKPFDPLQLVSTVRDLLGTSAFLPRPVAAR